MGQRKRPYSPEKDERPLGTLQRMIQLQLFVIKFRGSLWWNVVFIHVFAWNFEDFFQLVEELSGKRGGDLVYCDVACDNLTSIVVSDCGVERVSHVYSVTGIASSQNPMGSFVYIDYHEITHIEVKLQKGDRDESLVGYSQCINRVPDKLIFGVITLVTFEPSIEGWGGLGLSDCCHSHGDCRNDVTGIADGMSWSSHFFLGPFRVALVVERVVSGGN